MKYADSTYDRLFRKDLNYNNKLHRDDREHAKSRGLTVNSEVRAEHDAASKEIVKSNVIIRAA